MIYFGYQKGKTVAFTATLCRNVLLALHNDTYNTMMHTMIVSINKFYIP